MSLNKHIIIIFILSMVWFSKLAAQTSSDSLEFIPVEKPLNILSTKFDKQLNTYLLNSKFHYYLSSSNFLFNALEDYNSTLVRSSDKSIRDEHSLNLSGAYKISENIKTGIALNNKIYSDSRKIEINQASSSNAVLYGLVSPEDRIIVSPFFGYANNRQIGESDYGYIYGAEGYLNDLSYTNLDITSQARFKNEDISPRKNTLRYYNLLMTNGFSDQVSNGINVTYLQNRKDFYFTADSITANQFDIRNNIQSRIETSTNVQDRLRYNNFLEIFSLDLLGNITWRSIDRDTRYRSLQLASASIFDTKIDELRIDFESTARYNSENINGAIRFAYSERDEKHLTKNIPDVNQIYYDQRVESESKKNNNSQRVSLTLNSDIKFSESDRLTASLYQNKLRYDTPSLDNYDDRDEILSIMRLKYIKSLSTFFNVFLAAEGTYNHIVYIYSQKSSNNNINRIIKLTSGGEYRGQKVTSLNSFEVSANYTVYDFEDITPNYRSYSFRQYTANDSSRIKITRNLSIIHYGYIKLSEQGDLKWASFSTRPARYLQEIYSVPKFELSFANIKLGLGLRYYSLNTYNYKGLQRIIDTRYSSLAPLTEIEYSYMNRLDIILNGWYEFITINGVSDKQQANFTLQMNWNF